MINLNDLQARCCFTVCLIHAVGLTTLPPSCADCLKNLGVSTSWIPKGLSRPVVGGIAFDTRNRSPNFVGSTSVHCGRGSSNHTFPIRLWTYPLQFRKVVLFQKYDPRGWRGIAMENQKEKVLCRTP